MLTTLRRWWAKGAPERGDWHWLVALVLGMLMVLVLMVLIGVLLVGHLVTDAGSSDWSGRLFTYRDGRLDVDIGNIFLLAVAIGVAFRWFGHNERRN